MDSADGELSEMRISLNNGLIIMFFMVAAGVLAMGGITFRNWEFWVILTCMLFIRVLAGMEGHYDD